MKKLLAVAGVMVGVAAVPAQAEIVDVSVSQDGGRISLYGPLSRLISDVKGQYEIGGVLNPRTEEDLLLIHTGAMLTGDAGMKDVNLAAGVGLRGIYIGRDHDSGGSLAIGGQAELRFPSFDRLGFSIYGYGAPEVTSFGENEGYYEIGTGLDYQILKDASVYVGYRQIKAKIEDDDNDGNRNNVTADDAAHIGVRLNF